MVDITALKAEIMKNGMKQKDVYTQMGLTLRKWRIRLDKKKFDTDEMLAICEILHIENPMPIFFAKQNT